MGKFVVTADCGDEGMFQATYTQRKDAEWRVTEILGYGCSAIVTPKGEEPVIPRGKHFVDVAFRGMPEEWQAYYREFGHAHGNATVIVHGGTELTESTFVGRYCDDHAPEALAYRRDECGDGGSVPLNASAGFPCEYEPDEDSEYESFGT